MFVTSKDYIRLRKTFRLGNIASPKQFAEICEVPEAKIRALFRATALRNRMKHPQLTAIEPFTSIGDPGEGGGGIFIVLDEHAHKRMKHYAELAGFDQETFIRRAQRAGFEFLIKIEEEDANKEADSNTGDQ
ncbi:MAG TPA: hypothetical protein DCG24_02890 [Bacteroidetes bacterium]|nr:hypothetical protein [Chitinophagales bacterium]HAE13148.1 hypothetical protein [Bacteroidota bacterium]HAE35276.1 hypothetical protein [Bacteroidota bacterium]HQU38757.1 hypothetical protein [Chitinophagales bacterium]HQU76607.1 hypothetical protein [Chitinophagales bacterium]